MVTGFENISTPELCREWHTIMTYNTLDGISSSVRFMRVCQELDKRKISPMDLGKIIAKTNESTKTHEV